jgi:hypothetical protein
VALPRRASAGRVFLLIHNVKDRAGEALRPGPVLTVMTAVNGPEFQRRIRLDRPGTTRRAPAHVRDGYVPRRLAGLRAATGSSLPLGTSAVGRAANARFDP